MKFKHAALAVLTLFLFVAFAQAPVPTPAQLNAGVGVTNPQSLKCADAAVQNAITYLVQLGATGQHACVDNVVMYPGGSYTDSQLTWTKASTGVTVSFSAGLTAVWPGITAGLLSASGNLYDVNGAEYALPASFQPSALQPYQVATLPVPAVNVPSNAKASPPAVPIGPKVYVNTPDEVGDEYFTVPGETYLAGASYADVATARQWIKIAVPNPFGNSVFWLRIR